MNILIIQQRNWATNFGIYLADNLKKGHNIVHNCKKINPQLSLKKRIC